MEVDDSGSGSGSDSNGEEIEVQDFNFGFHEGFDLYVAARCGKKRAFERLESLAAPQPHLHSGNSSDRVSYCDPIVCGDPIACGYFAMSLARSENSVIPKDLPRAKALGPYFLPALREMECGTGPSPVAGSEFLADVFYLIAFCYEQGYGVLRNMIKAVDYYRKSTALGHPGASVNLSNCYDSGEGVAMNKAKVFELDNFAAELGHPIAINNLACCYLFGKGCSINHIQKLRLWERAAHMGYPMSQVNLGLTYYYGEEVRRDTAKAVKYFRYAAQSGLSKAQLMLGYCYSQGTGIPEDRTKAVEICRLAAAQGNTSAQYLVGCILFTVPGERDHAIPFLQDAAKGGNSDAQYFVAICYRDGEQGLPENIVESVRFFRKAASQDHALASNALTTLGERYKEELWHNRKSFWMFLAGCQFIKPPATASIPYTNSIHDFFYINDLCIFLSTFI